MWTHLYQPSSAVPVGEIRRSGLPLSRREFLGFLAVTPAVPSLSSALAEERPDDSKFDLAFELSADGSSLRVVRVDPKSREPAPGLKTLDLSVDMFGQKAWFDIAQPGPDPTRRTLYIRNIAYGDLTGGKIELRFQNAGGWKLLILTDVWLDSDGGSLEYKTETPVFLDDFISGKAEAVESLWASRVTQTFKRMFAGRIEAGSGKEAIVVGLTGRFQWHLRTTSRPLTAFAGQVSVTDFTLGWHEEAAGEATGVGPHFAGMGTTASVRALQAGSKPDLHFHLLQSKPAVDGGWQLEMRRGPSPLLPGAFQTVSRIVVGESTAEFVQKGVRVAGPLELQRVVATETSVAIPGKKEIVRTVISAAGAVEMRQGEADGDSVPEPKKFEITTPIGRMRVTGAFDTPEQPAANADGAPGDGTTDPKPVAGDDFGKAIVAANGDRTGAPGQTVWIVADRGAKAGEPQKLRRAAVDLFLHEADTALPDVSHSRLRFERAELRLAYADGQALGGPIAEAATPEASSFIWLGATADGPRRAALDLSRASLVAARDYDQMRLGFRFSDMVLAFTPLPIILPAREDNGVVVAPREERADMSEAERWALPEPVRVDTRPVLVVEFDPQHVMEEAIFRPELPPLPDVDLTVEQQAEAAKKQPELDQRKFIQAEKKKNETGSTKPFADFCTLFSEDEETADLSPEQRVYIGPDGLQPDAFEAARKLQLRSIDAAIKSAIEQLITIQAVAQIAAIQAQGNDPQPKPLPSDPDLRLELERKLESTLPLYSLFRSFYRDLLTGNSKMIAADPANANALDAEYLHPGNRTGLLEDELKRAAARDEDARAKFVQFAAGRDEIPDIVEARLSGPTRLAFRVNSRPGFGDGHDANGLPAFPDATPAKPGAAGLAFASMPFTFAALTDWSHHEPAVTRRAEKLFREAPSGIVPPLGEQAADLDDLRMLRHQGLTAGEEVTGAQRMSEIRASLAEGPTSLETAIEIPSRLVLSTAQDAVWQSSRRFPIPRGDAEFAHPPAVLEHGEVPTELGAPISSHSRDLWTARLLIDDILPGLRVVGTPDFRPMALQPGLGGGQALPAHFAPPRGAFAPWFIGAEQSNTTSPSPLQVHVAAFPEDADNWRNKPGGEWKPDAEFCDATDEESFPPTRRLRLVDWLCRRLGIRTGTEADIKFFRTSLDAYDRHELLLLSSAYGLPVTGKRKAIGEDVEQGGALVDGSGQFEPGKHFALLDGRNDEAIYRPVPLNATELTLSTLGGSFTHDTPFNPPATALDIGGRPFFSGLSIERWQHHIVLGRDIRAEVVYKGYLFPLGHRASLVKLTERIFVLTPKQGYKALLRQRMFLRIGKPDKKYPAVGQPNAGRQWCASDVLMLTRRTPDIVDPTTPVGNAPGTTLPGNQLPEMPNGFVDLQGAPGLAFWPKLDLTDQGAIPFQFTLDGKQTSMPLLFLDNVAATTPATVKKVADHYNLLIADRRSMQFNGQKLRFAEEMESGDTTFATDTVLVHAQGRRHPGGTEWGGNNSLYETTGVLEGAEQPPFYPAVEMATIHIEQVERLTGSGTRPTDVRYDGHFLDNGLRGGKKGVSDAAASGNPLEVFLDLVEPVRLDMGGSGDRSGGIARPNSQIYALSRSKGPLGAEEPGYQAKPNDPIQWIPNRTGIVSLAEYFRKAASRAPASATAVTPLASTGNDPGQLNVFEKFFSSDAKLLGIVKLRDLMKLFDLAGADLPLLKETMEFGSALQGAAHDALTLVRINVLLPLKAATGTISEQWDALDKRLAKAQANLTEGETVSIKTYFPEIEDGLNGLGAMLDAALAENDLLKLPKKLSAIYEAGKRFARLLATLAANAPERMREAVRDQLLNGISDILGARTALKATLEKLEVIRESDPAKAVAAAATEMIAAIELLDDLIPLPVPTPDLVAAVRVVGGTASELATAEDQARQVVDMLRAVVAIDKVELRKKISDVVAGLGNGEVPPEAAARTVAKLLVGEARAAIEGAVEFVEDDVDDPYRSRLLEVLAAYRARLDEVEGEIDSSTLVPPAVAQLLAELRRLRDAAESIKAFIAAVRDNDMDTVLPVAGKLARRLFGAELDMATVLKSPAAEAAASLDLLAAALRFTSGGVRAWPSDAEAEAAAEADLPEELPAESAVLQKIAAAWEAAGDLEAELVTARSEFDDNKDDLDNDTLRTDAEGVLTDTDALAARLKREIGSIYRHTVRLGRGLQAVQRSLHDVQSLPIGDGGGSTLNPSKLLQRLETARALAAAALEGLATAFGEIVRAFEVYLGKPKNRAALAGAFAATLLGSADIIAAFEALEGALHAAQSEIVACLVEVVDLSLTLLVKGSLFAKSNLEALRQTFSALPEVFDPERENVLRLLSELANAVPQQLREDFEDEGNPQTFEKLLGLRVTREEPTRTVRQFFIEGGASAEFVKVRDKLRAAELGMVDAYHSLLARAKALPQVLLDEAYTLTKPVLRPLAEGYGVVLAARDRLLEDPTLAHGLANAPVVQALTVPARTDFPSEGGDRLKQEAGWLKAAGDASDFGPAARKQLGAFLDGWLTGSAAPLVIAENLKELVVKATSGDILSMIDVAALRDEIEDALANLVPLRTTLAYDVNLATGEYGAGESSGKIFSLMKGSRFDVAVRVDIDLLGKDPVRFRADAKLGSFQVNLLGGIFDAVALKFHGASFLIEDGGKPSFDVDYDTFKIGKELEFAQKLQSFLSPSGSGFYLQPLDRLPGIEAGYGINLGTIQLGGISFSNVSLNVAALLPFTDSEALFRASLARRLAPFTISVPPFGGAGYFAITASAKKIVGFEASFEFGGSADFSFGPLVAYGRIMSGFYIRTQELPGGHRVTELSGTFFAGGAASIWIFNFYASLYVKLGMTEGGTMEGEAIFSFSFSMGIVDYDYSVRAASSQKAMGSGGGGSSSSAALESPTRFAGIAIDGVDRSIVTGAIPIAPDEYGFVTGVKVTTVCQAKDTAKYAGYFDRTLLENV